MAKNAVQPGKVLDYVNTTGALVRSGDVSGAAAVAFGEAAAATTVMNVKFTGVPGTVTP